MKRGSARASARFVSGWEPFSSLRLSSKDEECHPDPVPALHDLVSVAVASAGSHGGYFEFDSPIKPTNLPLRFSERRVHGLKLRLLDSPGTDLLDYQRIPDAFNEPAIVEILRTHGAKLHIDAFHFPHLLGAMPEHISRFSRKETAYWFHAPSAEAGWKSLYGRKSVKHALSKAKRELDLRMVTLTDPEEMSSWLGVLGQLQRERLRLDHKPCPFDQPFRADQYRAVLSLSRLTLVFDGDRPLAVHWGFVFDDLLLLHTPAVNIRYLDYSPFQILLAAVCMHCEEQGFSALDFGHGNEAYKRRFANRRRELFDVFIPVSNRALIIHGLRRVTSPTKVRLFAEDVVKRARVARTLLRRLSTRVVYFASPTNRVSSDDATEGVFREFTNWPEVVDAFRRSERELNRIHYDRIRLGDRLLCWSVNERLVSTGWLWSRDNERFFVSENGHWILAPGKGILYDFSTPVDDRRKGYYTHLLRAILRRYEGTPLIIYALSTNAPSLRGIKRAGFIEVSEDQI